MFMLERARDLMADGVTNTIVLFNFAGKRHGPPTSVSVSSPLANTRDSDRRAEDRPLAQRCIFSRTITPRTSAWGYSKTSRGSSRPSSTSCGLSWTP